MIGAPIFVLQATQFCRVKRRQSADLDAAQISAAALDPQNLLLLSAERIGLLNLRACVPASKIGDAKVRSQQIRSVPQQFRWIEPTRNPLIPAVFQIAQTGFHWHAWVR